MSSSSIDTRLTKLVDVQTKFKNANAEPLEALAKDHHMLLKSQVQLQEKLGKDFVGLTLHQTLSDLIQGDEIKQADKLKQDFKLTDRRYVFEVHFTFQTSRTSLTLLSIGPPGPQKIIGFKMTSET